MNALRDVDAKVTLEADIQSDLRVGRFLDLFFFAVRLRFALRFLATRLPASDKFAHSRQVRLRPNADNIASADDLFATVFILLTVCPRAPFDYGWKRMPVTQQVNVRFGSKADICGAKRHVRFTPSSDRESRHSRKVMSALPPKADICGAQAHVRFGPKADIRLHAICSFRTSRSPNKDPGFEAGV